MTDHNDGGKRRLGGPRTIQIAGLDLVFRGVELNDETPTGAQIAAAAGILPGKDPYVLQFLDDGELVEVLASQSVSLDGLNERFLVTTSDRAFRIRVDGEEYDWPAQHITGKKVRSLAGIPAEQSLMLSRQEQPDELIENAEIIDLAAAGVENFYTVKQSWKLKVQDVVISSDTPEISVRDAMNRAGFDPDKPWHIFLRVQGKPKQEVNIDFVVDLRTPGIEKLRLTPKNVDNGEAAPTGFPLLDVDEAYLKERGWRWETIVDKRRRWLLIHDYQLPEGYTSATATLALEIPATYPGAQIDMFYLSPEVRLASGAQIAATRSRPQIAGRVFQRWSRHRGAESPWDPEMDNVRTHLVLVDSSLSREVEG